MKACGLEYLVTSMHRSNIYTRARRRADDLTEEDFKVGKEKNNGRDVCPGTVLKGEQLWGLPGYHLQDYRLQDC